MLFLGEIHLKPVRSVVILSGSCIKSSKPKCGFDLDLISVPEESLILSLKEEDSPVRSAVWMELLSSGLELVLDSHMTGPAQDQSGESEGSTTVIKIQLFTGPVSVGTPCGIVLEQLEYDLNLAEFWPRSDAGTTWV